MPKGIVIKNDIRWNFVPSELMIASSDWMLSQMSKEEAENILKQAREHMERQMAGVYQLPPLMYVEPPTPLTKKETSVATKEKPVKLVREKVSGAKLDLDEEFANRCANELGYNRLKTDCNSIATEAKLKNILAAMDINPLTAESVQAYKAQKLQEAQKVRTIGDGLIPTWHRSYLNNYGKPVPEFVLQTALDVNKYLTEKQISCRFIVEELVYAQKFDPFLILSVGGQEYYLEVWNESGYKVQREV